MEVDIYIGSGRRIEMIPENRIGRIDDEGNVYEVGGEEEIYLGWIDFETGDVFDNEDDLVGWVEEDGKVIAISEDGEEEFEIGYVTEAGELYCYRGGDQEALVGQLKNMQGLAEGAAALLFFLDFEGK